MIYKTIVLLIILFGISFFLFYIFSGYYNIKSITLIDIEIKDNKKVISYKITYFKGPPKYKQIKCDSWI